MIIRRKKETKASEDGKNFKTTMKTEIKKAGKNYISLMKESTSGLINFN